MPGLKKKIRAAARKLKTPAKRIAKAAAKQALREVRGGARSLIARNPMINMGLRSLIGNGDYKGNNLVRGAGSHVPSFGTNRVIVSRREYIGRVVSDTVPGRFKLTKYRINPGENSTFPWLCAIAQNFESYKPLSLVFEFKSTSGESVGSTNTALGVVAMAPQYNAFAPDPTNRQQLEAFSGAISVAPYENALCGVECKQTLRSSASLLIRNPYSSQAAQESGPYDSLFDLGDFFIATDGCQGSAVALGELWVTYRMELFNPVLSPQFPWNFMYRANLTSPTPVDLNDWRNVLGGTIKQVGDVEVVPDVGSPTGLILNGVIVGGLYRLRLRFEGWGGSTGDTPGCTPFFGECTQIGGTSVPAVTTKNGYWISYDIFFRADKPSIEVAMDLGATSLTAGKVALDIWQVPTVDYW